MSVARADTDLRDAIKLRLEVAGDTYSDETRALADHAVNIAIERLILAALAVGRVQPVEVGHA